MKPDPRRLLILRVGLIAVAAAAALPFPGEARPAAVNQVERDGTLVTISVPIDLHVAAGRRFRIAGLGLTDGAGLASWWETGAESIWNTGLSPFLFRGCYTLEIDIQLNVVAADPFSGDSDHHQVYLFGSGYRSKVWRGGGAAKTEDDPNPYSNTALGRWGLVSPATVAHEVGHLLGLADDYTDIKDSSGRTTGVRSLPGRERTFMDNYRSGTPSTWFDQELVDRLGEMAGIVEPLPPCFQGTVSLVEKVDQAGHTRTGMLDLALAVSPNDAGDLEGLATGTFILEGRVTDGGCEFTYTTSAGVSLELTASGLQDGPYTVEAREQQRVEETQRHHLCATAVDLQIEWDIGLLVEDVIFRDGYYQFADETADVVLFYSGR